MVVSPSQGYGEVFFFFLRIFSTVNGSSVMVSLIVGGGEFLAADFHSAALFSGLLRTCIL